MMPAGCASFLSHSRWQFAVCRPTTHQIQGGHMLRALWAARQQLRAWPAEINGGVSGAAMRRARACAACIVTQIRVQAGAYAM